MDKDISYSSKEKKQHQDDFLVLNIYALNTRASTFVKKTLLKLELHITVYTLIVGNFSTPISPVDRPFIQELIYLEQ